MKNKLLKRVGASALTAVLSVTSLVACSSGDDSTDTASTASDETSMLAASVEVSSEDEEEEEVDLSSKDLEDMTAQELSIIMGNGINLGNTMEATDNSISHDEFIGQDVSYYETLWGQPETTKEMIDDFKEAGFDTLRIPVAWINNATDYTNGDYTIRTDYLERVKEIVDYAYDNDMFVILNDHWDGGWWGMFGAADEDTRAAAMDIYVSMWEQLCDYFGDYDYHLIFEGGNEEIGDRLNDIDNEMSSDGATLSKDECYEMALKINQTFVDTVRSSGKNNEKRFLLIPGYGTDITQTLDDRWSMPTDIEENGTDKLFLSVHFYAPWSYCGTDSNAIWGTKSNYQDMNKLLSSISKFVTDGYGVIIGECGVSPNSDGTIKDNALLWYKNFFANCDMYNMVPVQWNTGNIINKETHECIDESLLEFFRENSYSLSQKDLTYDEVKKNARTAMSDGLSSAPETFEEEVASYGDDDAIAWIMWNSQDYCVNYSVGDKYDPDSKVEGVEATIAEITGEGTYTVGLDFTGTDVGYSNSTAFSAIGITNGELLYPGYIITITSFKINGEEISLEKNNYTSSDDGICTRTNIYNEWVGELSGGRSSSDVSTCSAIIINRNMMEMKNIETLEITFTYLPGEEGISTNDANSKN